MVSKRRFGIAARTVAALIIAGCIAAALRASWGSVRDLTDRLDFRWVCAAAVLAAVYRVLNAAGWGMVLRALGHPLPTRTGVRLWLVAETMRWLPGSVWGFASRVYQAQKAGVPAAAASLSMPLELAITVVAWTLTALAGGMELTRIAADWTARFPRVPWTALAVATLAAPALGAVGLWHFRESKIARKARGFLGGLQQAFRARPRPLTLLATLAWFTMLCFLNGLTFYALLRAFAPPSMPSPVTVTGINAIGWLVGFFAVFSPGGLGVREGGMTALLSPLVPLPVAVGSVVLWRVVQIVVEVLCLGACYLPAASRFARSRGRVAAVPVNPLQPVCASSPEKAA